MAHKPETVIRKRLEALDRHRALLDGPSAFVKSHPQLADECFLKLLYGKIGLSFFDYARVIPCWRIGKVVMRLLKSGADWMQITSENDYYNMNRTVSEDVSKMSEKALLRLLHKLEREANPE